MKVTGQGSYYRLAVSTTAVLYTNDLYVAHQDISSLGDNIYLFKCATIIMQDRRYDKKKQAVEKFIRKYGKVDHSVILYVCSPSRYSIKPFSIINDKYSLNCV